MKRLITSMLIVLLLCVAFIGSFYKGYYSYAEDINYMSDAELEAAYQAYLQSKGGGLIGNAGARLAYTNGKMLNFLASESNTTPYKNINQVKGLLAWEKRELESGNSSVLQLTMRHPEVFSLYTQWLIQNHYFGNGVTDTDGIFTDGIDNTVFSGELFTDADGNQCLVYVTDGSSGIYNDDSHILAKGSYYKYTRSYVESAFTSGNTSLGFNLTSNNSATIALSNTKFIYDNTGFIGSTSYSTTSYYVPQAYSTYPAGSGGCDFVILKYTSNNVTKYYFGSIGTCYTSTASKTVIREYKQVFPTSDDVTSDINIYFYTNNNNNVVVYPSIDADGTLYIRPKVQINGEYKPYVINEGDTITNVVNNYYNDSGEKDKTITVPSTTPDSGSGGSGGSGGTLPNWNNPYPNLTPDGSGGFNFNFTLPDLNIDWNISGLSEKFPFSIPFDLIRFITVLNAEPETPHFEGTVNLIVYQWDIDADLSQFDNLASIVRNVEFIGFCITLVLITRKMIKG